MNEEEKQMAKKMKEEKKIAFCQYCLEEEEYITLKPKRVAIDVRGVKIFADQIECKCKKCGRQIYIHEITALNQLAAFDAYKEKMGLLTSVEIKAIRHKFNLSATSFAKILSLGEKNITRYENGEIQNAAIDTLMREFDMNETFATTLSMSNDKFNDKEKKKIEMAIYNRFNAFHLEFDAKQYKTMTISFEDIDNNYSHLNSDVQSTLYGNKKQQLCEVLS